MGYSALHPKTYLGRKHTLYEEFRCLRLAERCRHHLRRRAGNVAVNIGFGVFEMREHGTTQLTHFEKCDSGHFT